MDPTRLLIDIEQLHKNAERILNATSADVMAVLKANAYGHGVELAQQLEAYHRIKVIAVATMAEAIAMRAFTSKDILVLGVLLENQWDAAVKLDLISVMPIWLNPDALPGPMRFFVNIDTGFHRYGFAPTTDAVKLIEQLHDHDNVAINGIYTHLRLLDDDKDRVQITRFQRVIQSLSFQPRYVSIADSIALTRHGETGNLVRVGALLYGLESDREQGNLSVAPIATLMSRITHVTTLEAGASLYYRDQPVSRACRIATIPIGYADGLPRTMPKGMRAFVNGKAVSYLAVSMDHSAIDITNVEAAIGDDVTIIGGNGLSVADVARLCDTNKNDIVSGLHPRIPRNHIHSKGDASHDV